MATFGKLCDICGIGKTGFESKCLVHSCVVG